MTSSLRGVRLIAALETRLLLSHPVPVTILLIMPIILILFLENGLLPPPVAGGIAGTGANQAVPGIATMFAFFLVGYTGLAFYREHGWRTWERLRLSPIATVPLIVGKALPYLAIGVIQVWVLIGIGWIFLGMTVRGSPGTIAALVLLLSMSAVSLGLMLAALAHSAQQLLALSNLGAVLLGGIGGAFAPVVTYPSWAQTLARATPQYWAIDGFQQAMVAGSSLRDLALNLCVLIGFSALFVGLAAFRFDRTEAKESFLD